MATVESYHLAGPKDAAGKPVTKDGKVVTGALRYRVRYRTPGRRQTDKRGFRTKKEAQLFAATVEVSKARGEFISHSAGLTTVAEVVETWCAGWGDLAPSTAERYRGILRKYVLPKWGDVPVAEVIPSDVKAWTTKLLNDGLAAASVRKTHRVLSLALDVAVEDKLLALNAVRKTKIARPSVAPRRYLTHQQVDLLATAAGELGRPVILTLAYCGLRWGELAALHVKDVNLSTAKVRVRESVTEVGGKLQWGDPKTHQHRTVPVPSFLVPLLKERVDGRNPDDLVFPAAGGGVLRYRVARRSWFNQAVVTAGCPEGFHPHELRHTAASLAISAGANVKAVQKMLGHGSAAMTLDTYSDLFPDDLDAVGVSLDRARSQAIVGTNVGTDAKRPVPSSD